MRLRKALVSRALPLSFSTGRGAAVADASARDFYEHLPVWFRRGRTQQELTRHLIWTDLDPVLQFPTI